MGWQMSSGKVPGPLALFAVGYERWLVARGFRPGALPHRISQFACLSRWLEAEGLSVAELGPRRVEQFLAARRAAGYVTWVAPSSLRLPLEYLSEIGVVPASEASAAGPVDRLLEGYRRYLILERGLAMTTIDCYEYVARVFLEDRQRRRGGLELDGCLLPM